MSTEQDLNNEICNAASRDSHAMLAALQRSGSRVNCRDWFLDTPLHRAVKADSLEVMELLLARRAHVNADDQVQAKPIHHVCSSAAIALLLQHKSSIHELDDSKRTPLHYAASSPNVSAVKALLEARAHVDAASYRGTPLHLASRNNRLATMVLLLEAHADVNSNCAGRSPLFSAAECLHREAVELLLAYGAVVPPGSELASSVRALDRPITRSLLIDAPLLSRASWRQLPARCYCDVPPSLVRHTHTIAGSRPCSCDASHSLAQGQCGAPSLMLRCRTLSEMPSSRLR